MEKSLVVYRYPGNLDVCHIAEYKEQDVVLASHFKDVGTEPSFVFAPFSVSEDTPVVIFRNSNERTVSFRELGGIAENLGICSSGTSNAYTIKETCNNRDDYKNDFSLFHSSTCSGGISKVVLARSAKIRYCGKPNLMAIFSEACRRNPSCFVALVSSKASGIWLIATPEVLLEHTENGYHTMALAGTMKLGTEVSTAIDKGMNTIEMWSPKNIEEQRLVAQYIKDVLDNLSGDVEVDGPHTVTAGNIVHLRSDFYFNTSNNHTAIGDIIEKLHPTPAVCGMPVDKTRELILQHEHLDRRYYSGFCGTVDNQGESHLYVTLRCMQIHDNSFELFAGGGILPDSVEEEEWNETNYKMQAMMKSL